MVDFIDVEPEESVAATLDLMLKHNISSMLVTKEKRLMGIATIRDFVSRIPWGKTPLHNLRMQDIMTKNVLFLHPEDGFKELVNLIHFRDIRTVPVVSEGAVKGIVTRKELAKVFADSIGHKYQVKDLMTYRYNTSTIHESMKDLIRKMVSLGYKYIVVLAGNEVVGVVTMSDVLIHLYSSSEEQCVHHVKDVMTVNPITAKKDDRCDKIARTIVENRLSALPVVNDELCGLISLKCFFKIL